MSTSVLITSKVAATLALFTIALAASRVSAQNKKSLVIASVADAQSGQPLVDAEVKLADVNMSATTDWSGEARIAKVAAGQHQFEIRKAGYDLLAVTLVIQGDSIGPVFRLAKTVADTLTPVEIAGDPSTSYLAGFEKRRQQGRGKYLTAADLEQRQNRSLVQILAQTFSGLMTTPDLARPGHTILTSRRTRPRLTGADTHCGVDLYLDGSPYLDDLEALHPTELAGVEYYPVESAPSEYRKLTDNCAVVVLWSRK